MLAALDLLEKDTALVDSLSAVCERIHQRLLAVPHLTLTCHTSSPIKHLLPRVPTGDRDMDLRMLRDVVAKVNDSNIIGCFGNGVPDKICSFVQRFELKLIVILSFSSTVVKSAMENVYLPCLLYFCDPNHPY